LVHYWQRIHSEKEGKGWRENKNEDSEKKKKWPGTPSNVEEAEGLTQKREKDRPTTKRGT